MYAMNAMQRGALRFTPASARLGCPVRCRRQGIVVKKEDPSRAPTQGNDLREGSKVRFRFASVLHAASSNFCSTIFRRAPRPCALYSLVQRDTRH